MWKGLTERENGSNKENSEANHDPKWKIIATSWKTNNLTETEINWGCISAKECLKQSVVKSIEDYDEEEENE